MDAQVHPPTLEETPPPFLSYLYYWSKACVEQYGWFMLGGGLLLFYIWVKMQPHLRKWQEQQEERQYAAMCHKYPDMVRSRQEAMDAARERMQREHDENSKIHTEKMKERETRKREEYLAMQEGRGPTRLGYRLMDESNSSDPSNTGQKPTKPLYRPEYNPLMGGGASGGYRAPRRSCPGGGCG